MPTPLPASAGSGSRFFRLSWEARDRHRLVTLIALLGLAGAVAMAVYGLPPVNLHGPLHRYGIMDPLCGGTRAARYAAAGNWPQAWRYNPLGLFAVLASGAATLRAVLGVARRRWLTVSVTWTPRRARTVAVVMVALLAALDVRQQTHAALLMAGT